MTQPTSPLILQLLSAVRATPGATSAELAARIAGSSRHAVAATLPEIEGAGGLIERGLPRLCAVAHTKTLTWHPVWVQ